MKETFRIGRWTAPLASMLVLSACEGARSEDPDQSEQSDEAEGAARPRCHWAGASVEEGQWLECESCRFRYCQCQPDGRWGKCQNHPPPDDACDWQNPDWQNPACSRGGRKPCDWQNPDWQNPACQDTSPPGGGPRCVSCHSGGPPQGTPPPDVHDWL